MNKPTWRPCSSGSPQNTGSFAVSLIVSEAGTDSLPAPPTCSGPPIPNSQLAAQNAIQLSMIVVITSCAPTVALSTPATPAQIAPTAPATTTASTMCGRCEVDTYAPVITADTAPTVYWPCPP